MRAATKLFERLLKNSRSAPLRKGTRAPVESMCAKCSKVDDNNAAADQTDGQRAKESSRNSVANRKTQRSICDFSGREHIEVSKVNEDVKTGTSSIRRSKLAADAMRIFYFAGHQRSRCSSHRNAHKAPSIRGPKPAKPARADADTPSARAAGVDHREMRPVSALCQKKRAHTNQ